MSSTNVAIVIILAVASTKNQPQEARKIKGIEMKI